jgi:hypothetical protein
MTELAARLNAVDGRVQILAPSILTRMLDIADLRSMFTVGDPQPIEPQLIDGRDGALPDPAVSGPPRASRPHAGSRHRLSTGA